MNSPRSGCSDASSQLYCCMKCSFDKQTAVRQIVILLQLLRASQWLDFAESHKDAGLGHDMFYLETLAEFRSEATCSCGSA
jgi:hypothetical protein